MDCIKTLTQENYHIVSVEQADNSIDLQNFVIDKSKKLALIFGNEVNGVSDECISMSDEVIEIPQHGTKHSFNVSVSAGIVLWDLVKKL